MVSGTAGGRRARPWIPTRWGVREVRFDCTLAVADELSGLLCAAVCGAWDEGGVEGRTSECRREEERVGAW